MKFSLLVNGWINIPHSYAIVNCMQLIHLHKNFKDQVDIYIQETEYYGKNWFRNSQSIYNDEYTAILNQLRRLLIINIFILSCNHNLICILLHPVFGLLVVWKKHLVYLQHITALLHTVLIQVCLNQFQNHIAMQYERT